ncbi:MAG TPA: phosphoesterase [Actinomycetes bacterium]|nr:phosphoesterase [Actinomycetes bacterium]
MGRKLSVVLGLVVALTLGSVALAGRQPARAAVDSMVLVWNEQALESIRRLPPGPTVAARALAVVHTAIYDTWAAYDPVAVDTRQRLRVTPELRQPAAERTPANKDKAVSFAAYTALVDLFPARQSIFRDFMERPVADGGLGYRVDGSDTSTAATIGTLAAQAVLDFRHADGSNQLNGYADSCDPACYQPVNTWNEIRDADRWQPLCVPTPPPGATTCAGVVQRFLTPHWRNVTPFGLSSASQFRSPGPAISLTADGKPNGKYQDEVDKMTQHSKQLDDTRKTMAEYWADGPRSVTPPGHWNLFAQYVSRRDANTLDEDARLYFALNNALLDASITAWDGKRNWDSVRPITAVRWLMRGKIIQAWGGPYKGPSYIKGEDWIPYQPPTDPTPSFAEYTSGHSTFSLAAAEVLTAFCGRGNFEMTVTIPAGSSKVEPRTATQPGVPAKPITLKWTNFRYAAEQAGQSREYGGIHFEAGDQDARDAGAKVGKNAWAKALTYFNGTAT